MPDAKQLEDLAALLAEAATGLKKVTAKKMFGCQAFWADGNVFGLIWKHGRIGVKLPDEKDYAELMKREGSEPWRAGPMQMAHWVLVPEALHQKPADLKKWVTKAHQLCITLPKEAAKVRISQKSAKKSTKKVPQKSKNKR